MSLKTATAFSHTQTPRIFCIGRNYVDHIKELGHDSGRPCVIFMKPPSALVADAQPLPLPNKKGSVHYEAELVVEIGTPGHQIKAQNAAAHIAALGLGLDMTLRDLQNELKATGEPWEACKSFDHSAALGPIQPFDSDTRLDNLEFMLHVNGQLRQHGQTKLMINGITDLISQLSHSWALIPGDLIYTGTPKGVGAVHAGDELILTSPSLPKCSWTIV